MSMYRLNCKKYIVANINFELLNHFNMNNAYEFYVYTKIVNFFQLNFAKQILKLNF